MTTKAKWNPHLQAITDRYAEFYESIVTEVETMSEADVIDLIRDCGRLTRTNCSWLMYHAANDLIRAAIPYETWCEATAEGAATGILPGEGR